ncbi:Cof-type HAD-IIB family hydrolase [Candidatus Stoquefichus sp. SB1]|uniref:Cof-type HAD-IIB family hydrolase n=1 Tax=Candidatus Stoquefichus sp. SB1 TaxID=1658109 RepID=UPI00067F30BA|nr:Cof-type HAD-IIB family hydrolase [Candidatus Stoquefichus sp. SB1]
MKRYLICSDIDGTLMTSQQTISKKTRNLIHQLQKQGHLFFVATGRMHLSAMKIAEDIGSKTGVIASNGGVLSLNNEIITYNLDVESSLSIYRLAIQYNLPLFFFTQNTVYYSSILPDYFQNDTDKGRVDSGKQESYCKIKNEADLIKHASEYINAIIISEDDIENLQIVKEKLTENTNIHVSSSFWNNIEIVPKGVSKATAIHQLQKHYQIDQQHTISFGDGGNDIDMFKASSISVAMENATNEVKAHAKYLTSSNNDDGVYQFLYQYFMEEKENGK